jgi:hypothetical protein
MQIAPIEIWLSHDVVEVLDPLAKQVGLANAIRIDQGTEFVSRLAPRR